MAAWEARTGHLLPQEGHFSMIDLKFDRIVEDLLAIGSRRRL